LISDRKRAGLRPPVLGSSQLYNRPDYSHRKSPAEVSCGASDIGTGTYTIVAQAAADTLGRAHQRLIDQTRPDWKLPLGWRSVSGLGR